MTAVLGIDVGTTAVRAAVVEEDGRVSGRGRAAHDTRFGPRRAEQDPRLWTAGAYAAVRGALAEAGERDIAAVGVAALGPAPVLVDRELDPLTPALLFALDRRAESERRKLEAELGLAEGELTHDHAIPKLLWWRENEPAVWRRAAFALDATGFVVSALTGRPAMDSITHADYALAGYPAPLPLPDPADPLAFAGELAPEPAREVGLAGGIPVTAGTYDTYADVAAAGARGPGDACIVLGSTLVVCRVVAGPVASRGLELSPYPGDGFLLGGWTTTAGAALAWFERALGEDGALVREAEALAPGAGGLVALPYLAGERTPVRDPAARGLVLGLTLTTRRAELYRALVDAVALSARDHVERLAEAGETPDRWLVSGGGTRNRAWLEATGNAVGAPLAVVADAGEAVGPAHLALRALGLAPTRSITATVVPDPERRERFTRLYAVYRDLYPALAGAMRSLDELADEEAA